ncbi:hypothetical protein Anas_04350 [Armadillidium nasatum]|uniref:Uncharacterized protein n=1 Tax=Armadillidium nasatum TaxID=96803 RepID=A0A5N5SZM9_9CRUS|nr:hypothetical protein Anas_04350 [Armadillidium nasatum]
MSLVIQRTGFGGVHLYLLHIKQFSHISPAPKALFTVTLLNSLLSHNLYFIFCVLCYFQELRSATTDKIAKSKLITNLYSLILFVLKNSCINFTYKGLLYPENKANFIQSHIYVFPKPQKASAISTQLSSSTSSEREGKNSNIFFSNKNIEENYFIPIIEDIVINSNYELDYIKVIATYLVTIMEFVLCVEVLSLVYDLDGLKNVLHDIIIMQIVPMLYDN